MIYGKPFTLLGNDLRAVWRVYFCSWLFNWRQKDHLLPGNWIAPETRMGCSTKGLSPQIEPPQSKWWVDFCWLLQICTKGQMITYSRRSLSEKLQGWALAQRGRHHNLSPRTIARLNLSELHHLGRLEEDCTLIRLEMFFIRHCLSYVLLHKYCITIKMSINVWLH